MAVPLPGANVSPLRDRSATRRRSWSRPTRPPRATPGPDPHPLQGTTGPARLTVDLVPSRAGRHPGDHGRRDGEKPASVRRGCHIRPRRHQMPWSDGLSNWPFGSTRRRSVKSWTLESGRALCPNTSSESLFWSTGRRAPPRALPAGRARTARTPAAAIPGPLRRVARRLSGPSGESPRRLKLYNQAKE